jgi:predicted kinase
MLVVFSGLPGVGKTTVARAFAQECGATFLRIDTIEQALRGSGMLTTDVGAAGYLIAYALAETNLRIGATVVGDAVNPIRDARNSWRKIARETESAFYEIEVICSDAEEHRRRVQTRASDIAGLKLPTWQDVTERAYEPWDRQRLVLDTAHRSLDDLLRQVRNRMEPTG